MIGTALHQQNVAKNNFAFLEQKIRVLQCRMRLKTIKART